ncbi:prolyl oligopeptidase family serine peptidase [Nocardiopsis coralliicola]
MADLRYPNAARSGPVEMLHGQPVADPYRWLEDADSAAAKDWSAAQDELYRRWAQEREPRDGATGYFTAALERLLGAGYTAAPVWRGERSFWMRRAPGQEHGVLLTAAPGEPERVLIDPGALDPDGTTTLDGWFPDQEGRLLAYLLSEGGDEESRLRVMDIATGETVDGPIDRTRHHAPAWLPGGDAFYYVRRLPPEEVPAGEAQYHRRVYLHRVGRPTEEDVLVFGAGRDMTEFYALDTDDSGRYLLLTAALGTSAANDAWVADLSATGPEAPRFTPIQVGADAEVDPRIGRDGRLYLFTDRDSPRGRVCVCDPAEPDYAQWRTLVGPDPQAVLDGYVIADGAGAEQAQLVALWSRHAVSEVTRHDLETGALLGRVELPGLGSVTAATVRDDGGHEVWLSYTDHTTPPAVYRLDVNTGALEPWAQAPGAAELDLPGVRVEQAAFASADGTTVRMLVLTPCSARGPLPTVLYGYGGFRLPLTPGYSANALAWVQAGGAYAIAGLRGGLEEGEEWHRDGMLDRKQNVFDDFAAAAEHLVARGTADPERLAVMGGSNGGLLVGAAITQRPELFAAAVCSAPLLDMVRYERFGLGRLWNVEFGSADDPEQLGWLLGYSPYHRVAEGVHYPSVLFTVFDNDTRVDPLHARKMCAALQYATASPPSQRPVLLRRESEVGHSARSVSRSIQLGAEQLAYLARGTGLAVPSGTA